MTSHFFRSSHVMMLIGVTAPLLGVSDAKAQWYVPDPTSLSMSSYINSSYISNTQLDKGQTSVRPTVKTPAPRTTTRAPMRSASLTFKPASAPFMPDKMAAQLPQAQRADAKKLYSKLLSSFDQIAGYYSIPKYDVGGSVAIMIVASHENYTGEEVNDVAVKAVIAQIRRALGNSQSFAQTTDIEKQVYYEQTAILGTLMASLFKDMQTAPDPAIQKQARIAGKGYLESALGVKAESVSIDETGLSY